MIHQFINHEEEKNAIYLFLRPNKSTKYAYFGKLRYLTHDSTRGKPVHFQWQIIDWETPPINVLGRFSFFPEDKMKLREPEDEKELIEHIIKWIEAEGFYFSEETIKNFYISLKTKPFVLLCGISGIGKTALTRLFARAIQAEYKRIAVQANWNDDSDLWGYYNPITGEKVKTEFSQFWKDAEENPKQLFIICLDEMNLARCEYYFAKVLSGIEAKESKIEDCPPPNLFFVGTVNIDETTQAFSPKVLDRANTIELLDIDFGKPVYPLPKHPEPLFLSMKSFEVYKTAKINYDSEVIELLEQLYNAMLYPHFRFGYRIRDEILRYISNSEGILEKEDALDIQIKQKILPKLGGSKFHLEKTLENLKALLEGKFPRSNYKITNMLDKLRIEDFASFYD